MFALVILLGLVGCVPSEVDLEGVEKAAAGNNVSILCVGLKMEDSSVRTLAAQKMQMFGSSSQKDEAAQCLCDNLKKADNTWDEAIAEGMRGEKTNKLTSCFAKMVEDPQLQDRAKALTYLSDMATPAVLSSVKKIAGNDKEDPAVRGAAIEMIGGQPEMVKSVIKAYSTDNADLQASAIKVMSRQPKEKQFKKYIRESLESPHPQVRQAGINTARIHFGGRLDEQICKMMLEDEDVGVRKTAVMSFKGTTRKEAIPCLSKKATTEESSSEVRDALLTVLKSTKGAARDSGFAVLCDAIPFWLRTYVKDDVVTNLEGVGIVKAQNDVDHENSRRCFEKAYNRSSGYSCYAKMHISLWYGLVLGKDEMPIPLCPGFTEYGE